MGQSWSILDSAEMDKLGHAFDNPPYDMYGIRVDNRQEQNNRPPSYNELYSMCVDPETGRDIERVIAPQSDIHCYPACCDHRVGPLERDIRLCTWESLCAALYDISCTLDRSGYSPERLDIASTTITCDGTATLAYYKKDDPKVLKQLAQTLDFDMTGKPYNLGFKLALVIANWRYRVTMAHTRQQSILHRPRTYILTPEVGAEEILVNAHCNPGALKYLLNSIVLYKE